MVGSNFICALIALILVVFAAFKLKPQDTKEDFLGNLPNFSVRVDREVKPKGSNMFYSIPGNYQSILAPRFSNTGYGAYINYNIPSMKNQGVPQHPLDYGNMAYGDTGCASKGIYGDAGCSQAGLKLSLAGNKGYGATGDCVECFNGGGGCGNGSCGAACGCRKGGGGPKMTTTSGWSPMSSNSGTDFVGSNYSVPSYKAAQAKQLQDYTTVQDMLPVGDMTMMAANGELTQPIVYDRLTFSNSKSKLYGLGDPIRGDLRIVPCATGWFRPSVIPNIDLRSGAIGAISGLGNETNQELLAMQNAAAGGLMTTGSGVNFTVDKSPYLTHGSGDLTLTAFP